MSKGATSPEEMIASSMALDMLADADNDEETSDETDLSDQNNDDADDDTSDDDNQDEDDDGETPDDEDTDDQDDQDDDADDEDDSEDDDQEHGEYDADYLYYDEDEGREIFLRANTEDGTEESIYLTRQDAEDGLRAQLEFIAELKGNAEKLQQEKVAVEEQLAFFSSTMDETLAKELLIRQRMPKDLAAVSDEQLASDSELKTRHDRARIRAEIQLEHDINQKRSDREAQQNAAEETKKHATEFVTKKLKNLKELGIRNTENQRAFRKKLKEEVNGTTVQDVLETATQAWGDVIGDMLINGFAANFRTNTQKEVVEKTKDNAKTIRPKKPKTGGGKPSPKTLKPEEMISGGLKKTGRKRRV